MNGQFYGGIPLVEWPVERDDSRTDDEAHWLAASVGDACRHFGYFFMSNHGISANLIVDAFNEARSFYSCPLEQKCKFNCSIDSQFLGYRGLGAEKSRMHSGGEACEQYRIGNTAATLASSQLIEFYHQPFRNGTKLFGELVEIGNQLMSTFASSLGLNNTFFDCFMKAPMHRLGLNYYMVGAGKAIGNSVNYAMTSHVDHAVFTILMQDEPGLEVLSIDGEWINVPLVPNALFVFFGDYIQRWTNGVYRATTHRVREVSNNRLSLQYKHKPSYASVVAPLSPFVCEGNPARYEPFETGQQYEVLLQSLLTDSKMPVRSS